MNIKILKTELINKQSKAGNAYQLQRLLVEFGDERTWLEYYFGKDSVKLDTGNYTLSADSIRIDNKKLVISDFPVFEKVAARAVA